MANITDFEKFIEELKNRVDLVEIIESTSSYRFETRRVGRFIKCKHPDSLMVDPDWGQYTWFAKAGDTGHQHETGDVFHWLERYGNMGFWEAAQYLAQRYGVRMPEMVRKIDAKKEAENKTRGEMFEIACKWFEAKLWTSEAALNYCHKRGWTDETIRQARLGFTPGYAALPDLRAELSMHNVNFDDPTTVSIVGKRGGVGAWILQYGIEDASADWLENDLINGLGTFTRLIFPHVWRGRVNYFSSRNLDWNEDGELIGRDKPKSWNLPRALVGDRQRYYNFAFTKGAENCLVVEGQPDAISAGQLGIAAVALAGVAADAELATAMKFHKIKRIFMGLDNDPVGQENQVKAAALFGPMTRLITWTDGAANEEPSQVQTSEVEANANEPTETETAAAEIEAVNDITEN